MAGKQSFKQINTQDPEINRLQDNISSLANQIQTGPFFGGSVITTRALVSGQDNLIPHGLGRTPQYWFLLDLNTNTAVWRTGWDAVNLKLRCGTNCNVVIWVN